MAEARKPPGSHVAREPFASGEDLLALARADTAESVSALRESPVEELVDGILCLPVKQRYEFLELSERVDEIVPKLSEADFANTVLTIGLADAGWLVEFASPEQRVAAVDLDCWRDLRLSPSKLFEWIDAMIEAGTETLVAAFDELDMQLWVLALKRMASFSMTGSRGGTGDEPEDLDEAVTLDGTVWYTPRTSFDEERLREILSTAITHSPGHYWQFAFGAITENIEDAAQSAGSAHAARMNDLGFPERRHAMRAYRPLAADAARTTDIGEKAEETNALAVASPLPERLAGTLVGRAIRELPAARASEVLGYVLAVANTLAVADELPLTEPESVERSLTKALRGIDRGLRELSSKRNEHPRRVLDQTPPLDLFRVGATLLTEIGPGRTLADLSRDDELDEDWAALTEMVAPEDRTIAPDGKPA